MSKKVKHPDGLEFFAYKVTGKTRKGKQEYWWRVWRKGREVDGSTEGYSTLTGAANNYKANIKALIGYCPTDVSLKISVAMNEFKSKSK